MSRPWHTFRVLALLLVVAGCKREEVGSAPQPESVLPLVVAALGVKDLTQAEERPQGYVLPDVAAWARAAAGHARALRLDEGVEGGARLSLALLYGVVGPERTPSREPLDGAVLALGVRADLVQARPGEPPLLLSAERIAEHPVGEADRAALAGTLDRHLQALVRDAINLLDTKVALTLGPEGVPLRALTDVDPEVAAFAAQVAGERRLVAAGPGLIKLLDAADEGARLKAIGALGQLRHAPAAPALAHLAGGHERPAEIAAAVQALADLATPDARRYLGSIRDSTPFDDVRRLAEEALKRD